MKFLLSTSNALTKWLKADFPRLPNEPGKQAGVNKIHSDSSTLSWQVHIIDNQHRSTERTIIACEANSRFTFFKPLDRFLMSPDELGERLTLEWLFAFVEAIEANNLLGNSDIVAMLAELDQINFDCEWVKNTDRSVNGNVTDAALWITDTLRDRKTDKLSPQLAMDISVHINSQTKKIKTGERTNKDKFVPVERLLELVQQMTSDPVDMSNVVPFRR